MTRPAALLAVPFVLGACATPNAPSAPASTTAVSAPGAQRPDIIRTAAAAPDQATRLFAHSHLGTNCRSDALPTIEVTTPPSSGTVVIRETVVTAATTGSARTNCLGATTSGVGVFYTPAAGFTGLDRFRYTLTNPGGRSQTYAVIVGVR